MEDNELVFLRAGLERKIYEIPDDKLEAVANFIESCINKNERKITLDPRDKDFHEKLIKFANE